MRQRVHSFVVLVRRSLIVCQSLAFRRNAVSSMCEPRNSLQISQVAVLRRLVCPITPLDFFSARDYFFCLRLDRRNLSLVL